MKKAVAPKRPEHETQTVSEPPKTDTDRIANDLAALETDPDASTSGSRTLAIKAAEERVWAEATVQATHEHLGMEHVKEVSGALLKKIREFCNREDALIVLYFDESHVLHKALDPLETKTPRSTRYTTLCWALNLMANTKGVFYLFLSTNSHLVKFAPIPSLFPSARLNAEDADHLQAPYTELPFDCCDSLPIRSGTLDLAQSNELAHLCQFGRPL